MSKNIEKHVKEVLAKHFSMKEEDIRNDSSLIDDLGLDSFGMVEMLFVLKDRFGLEIPQVALINMKTAGDVINYLETQIGDKSGGT